MKETFKQLFKTLLLCLTFQLIFITCGKDSCTEPSDNSPDKPKVEKLSFFEEELLGLWSRYHSYDGSTMYIRFNADRSACDWEEANGSNYRKSESSFSHWYVDEENPDPNNNNRFKIIIEGAGISYTFDYPSNRLWPKNYTNLKYSPSSEGKTCE